MNETIKTILSRRSVRSYSTTQIKDEELDLILKAGLYAPSGHNQQAWHFTVIQDKKMIDEFNLAAKEEMVKSGEDYLQKYGSAEDFHLFYHSPTVIVISGEKTSLIAPVDCAAATENMLIAAESLNIGTCWIGLVTPLFKSDRASEFEKLFDIPEGYEPYYAITAGYKTQENSPALPRRENTVNYIRS